MSARTVTETDMASFEGALDEQWCHVVNGQGPVCGADGSRVVTHKGDWLAERCDGCGLRNCPECRQILKAS